MPFRRFSVFALTVFLGALICASFTGKAQAQSILMRRPQPAQAAPSLMASPLLPSAAPAAASAPASAPDMAPMSNDPVIQDIHVEGAQRLEAETVTSYLSLNVGDAATHDKMDASLKALYATGLFNDVRLSMQGSTLVVKVEENPIINRITFEGNSEISKDDLEKEVQLKSASGLHPAARATRRAAYPRSLSPLRPFRRRGQSQDRQTGAKPRRSGFRDHRRQAHRRAQALNLSATAISATTNCVRSSIRARAHGGGFSPPPIIMIPTA